MMYQTNSEQETFDFGAALGAGLQAGDCVLLTGDLGAGKSVVARGVASAHGVTEAMPSPTFVLMIPHEGDLPVYHFDLYRLEDPDEFYQAGLQEYLGGDGIAVIEWPECANIAPPGAVRVEVLRGEGAAPRRIRVKAPENLQNRLAPWRID